MRERMSFERQIAKLDVGSISFETKPAPTVDFTTAKQVMWEIIRIVSRQQGEQHANPDRSTNRQRKAATDLKRDSRSSKTRSLFHKIFRVRPEFVPTWLKPTATIKDRGDAVATRCKRVAELLASGTIKSSAGSTREFGRFEEGLNTAGLAIDRDKVFSKFGLLPSRLASLLFYKRHPERHQRPLNDGDPGIAEWPKIRDDIVRPQLFRKFLAEDDCRFLPDDQQLGLPIAA
jgi:hypothetical protein